MRRLKLFVLFTAIALILNLSYRPFCANAATPSNSGFTGLWEYPTAELPGDGAGWIHYSRYSPYRTYAANLGLFPWLEFNLRLTEYENDAAKVSEAFGYYKDKGLDLKLLLIEQNRLIPSVAAGVMDMMGTELRKGYFGAATWRYGKTALTLGYATDMYNGFYGGISWAPLDWLEFKVEYSPMDYASERVSGVLIHPHEADSKFNYGVVLKTDFGLMGSLSYQRGEELCFGISYAYDLNKPLFGGSHPPKAVEPLTSDWKDTDIKKIAAELQEKLGKKGFGLRNVVVLAGDKRVHVAFENIGYASQSQAMARAIIEASRMIPWDTESFTCVLMARGLPVSRLELNTEQMALVRMDKIREFDIGRKNYSWADKTKYGTLPDSKWEIMAGPGESIRNGWGEIRAALAFEPRIDKQLDKMPFMARTDLDWIAQLRSSQGWAAYLKVRQPLHNNVEIWWEPEMNDTTRIWKGVFSYLYKFDKNLWALGEFGYLNENYFGANLWGRWYLPKTNLWGGGRLSVTKERDYDSFGGIADYKLGEMMNTLFHSPMFGDNDWELSWWVEGGYHDSTYNADVTARYGKFVDGDKGYRLDAVRNWDAAKVGFYYTDTDRKTTGKSFTDAGMILHLPLSVWYDGHASNTYWDEEFTLLSTFRLFAGKMPGAWQTPEALVGELQPERLYQEVGAQLERLCMQMRGDDAWQSEAAQSYGFVDYVSGKWRIDKAVGED
ncbi:MAG: YjbH domain-containing protein [Synergistaceae bacterium]|nr:YjbH domain-containing protein [Synergistaceae bacterium]